MFSSFESRPSLQRWIVAASLLALTIHAYVSAFFRATKQLRDFDIHREFGRRFVTGEYLYALGFCHPYMPMAAMFWSPLALVPRGIGFMARYAIAVGCLWATFLLIHRMHSADHATS